MSDKSPLRREAEAEVARALALLPKGTPRDPSRIEPMIQQLRALWLSKPDWRLGQIIVNAGGTADPFYVEDDQMRDGLALLADPGKPSSSPAGSPEQDT